ncbi:hypothetical protein PC121_g25563, partial [Phytophthora cactorum]
MSSLYVVIPDNCAAAHDCPAVYVSMITYGFEPNAAAMSS